jgi:hypothetical protein
MRYHHSQFPYVVHSTSLVLLLKTHKKSDQKNHFFFVRKNRVTDRVTQFHQQCLFTQDPIKNPNDQN